MESTGSYGKPLDNLLETTCVVWLVNPAHVKALRGRKTDVKDSQWLAELLTFGLVVPRFIPDRPQRELREAVRYRRRVIEEQAREVHRIQKVLERGHGRGVGFGRPGTIPTVAGICRAQSPVCGVILGQSVTSIQSVRINRPNGTGKRWEFSRVGGMFGV